MTRPPLSSKIRKRDEVVPLSMAPTKEGMVLASGGKSGEKSVKRRTLAARPLFLLSTTRMNAFN